MHGSQLNLSSAERPSLGITPAGRRRAIIGEIIRFGIAGVLNTSWCLAILFVLHEKLHVNLWLASFTGYAVATVHSFLLNKYWTFSGDHQTRGAAQFIAFVALNIAGSAMFSPGGNQIGRASCRERECQ